MSRLGIDRDFLHEFAALERPVQQRVSEVFEKFAADPHSGRNLEKINNVRDGRLRSIRITKFYRGIVLAPERGDNYTLLKVLPHDDAYDWAQRRQVGVNRATGAIEIRDVVTLEAALPRLSDLARHAPSRLFAQVGDGDLRRLGIDDQTLAFARALTDTAQLDAAQAFLPKGQWDVLYGLAAGMSPEEVWAEVGAAAAEGFDEDDIGAAVARSADRVVLVEGPQELMAVFASPFDLWRIYLHPAQRAVVEADYRGPARVTGGPGTGKTVVAMHRAHRLAKAGAGPVLVTTFTSTLADSVRAGVAVLVGDRAVADLIEVSTVDSLAHKVFRARHGAPAMLGRTEEKALWEGIAAALELPFTPVFLAEEWRQVVLARRVGTAADYLSAKRTGRGRPLGPLQKAQVWQAVWEFEQNLATTRRHTHETVRREATRLLEDQPDKPYRHIVVDEAQDLSPDQWRLVRAAVPHADNDIFIAGDSHQRIYNHVVSFKDVGIAVAGRSRRLTVNYRTTAEILAWSLGLLRGEKIDDMDGGLDQIAGYRSEVHGYPPMVRGFATVDEEAAFLADTIAGWAADGVTPGEVGVAVRANSLAKSLRDRLAALGVNAALLKEKPNPDAVSVGTMHRMKGLEFRCVAVAAVGEGTVPMAGAVTAAADDPATHAHDLLRERCLAFVACTRAREQLAVTWHGPPSRFLAGLV